MAPLQSSHRPLEEFPNHCPEQAPQLPESLRKPLVQERQSHSEPQLAQG
jgi:hypothetical protein